MKFKIKYSRPYFLIFQKKRFLFITYWSIIRGFSNLKDAECELITLTADQKAVVVKQK